MMWTSLLLATLQAGRFGEVHVYRGPHAAEREEQHVAIFLSGDGGWNLGVVDMAKNLAELDTLVIGVDTPRYARSIETSKETCAYPAGDLETLSMFVQKELGRKNYTTPIVAGYSSGATLAYIAQAQAPEATFLGTLSLGFCADFEGKKPPCRGQGLASRPLANGKGFDLLPDTALKVPWVALHGDEDQVCKLDDVRAFVARVGHGELVALEGVGHGFGVARRWRPQFDAAFAKIARLDAKAPERTEAPMPQDLPLATVPVKSTAAAGGPMALIISGDGGWASMDRELADALASKGIPVVGLNSLSYFWAKKSPDDVAKDVTRVLTHFAKAWNRDRFTLIGYSFGADVLPAVARRLPQDVLAKVGLVSLISPSKYATFEIHVSDWFGGSGDHTQPVLPDVKQLGAVPLQCFYGKKDDTSLCPSLPKPAISVGYDGGHRMNPHVTDIANRIAGAALAH